MKLEIYGKNYTPSTSLISITEKKNAKLDKVFADDDASTAKYVVTLENGTYTTELVVIYRTIVLRASAVSSSPFDNVDSVIPKLLGQFRKQKDIWQNSKKAKEYFEEVETDEE